MFDMNVKHTEVGKMTRISQTKFPTAFSWKKCILIKISLKFVPLGSITNQSALVREMSWRRKDDKPLPEAKIIRYIDTCIRQQAFITS